MIEVIDHKNITDDLWRQFTLTDLEDEIKARFHQLYNRDPEHIYEVHHGENIYILAGPVRTTEKHKKLKEMIE